jgi:hypothetical protein
MVLEKWYQKRTKTMKGKSKKRGKIEKDEN